LTINDHKDLTDFADIAIGIAYIDHHPHGTGLGKERVAIRHVIGES
jgi:hypothetical protein